MFKKIEWLQRFQAEPEERIFKGLKKARRSAFKSWAKRFAWAMIGKDTPFKPSIGMERGATVLAKNKDFTNRPFADKVKPLKQFLKQEEQAKKAAKQAKTRKGASAGSSSSRTNSKAELDDFVLFQREMRGVKRIAKTGMILKQPKDEPIPPVRTDEAEAIAQLADLVAGRIEFDFSAHDEHIEGIAQGLDKRLVKRLRQGHFAVQAHLDLHGKTRVEARELVEQFILASRQRGLRCVLIIHGRGLNSYEQIPVLKENLKVWLAKGRIARSVLAFCSARPTDGGVGAVYVLLRK